ncbi:MAG: MBL fold metallo-hydrolase, partial [archaeon]|nr:MBL fold metallo-hydrolase [archaeon]
MDKEIITVKSGKINDYLHHVDLKEFGTRRVLSCFIAEFDDCNIILDCGTSLEIKHLLRYSKRNEIDLSKVKYLVTTHHHFDHAGGMWKLYEKIINLNPNVKILTNQDTKKLLNDYDYHLGRAKRTFGDFIGEMKAMEDGVFQIYEPSINFNSDPSKLDVFETFKTNGTEVSLSILKTPGHTHDHQCPLFVKDGEIDFLFFGEAVGTLYHSSKLVSMPTSMPVYFKYDDY